MASIFEISGFNPEVDKNSRKKINDTSDNSAVNSDVKKTSSTTSSRNDTANISNESVKLFNLQKESKKYLEMVKNVHLLSEKQLQELKENVLSDYYSEYKVVESIAEKVSSMTNFKN